MLRAERVSEYGLIAAALVISALPVVIVFVFFQEKIMSAMYSGGVKG
jgi:ABC-type glycerol-3-phosphate transport system permease component